MILVKFFIFFRRERKKIDDQIEIPDPDMLLGLLDPDTLKIHLHRVEEAEQELSSFKASCSALCDRLVSGHANLLNRNLKRKLEHELLQIQIKDHNRPIKTTGMSSDIKVNNYSSEKDCSLNFNKRRLEMIQDCCSSSDPDEVPTTPEHHRRNSKIKRYSTSHDRRSLSPLLIKLPRYLTSSPTAKESTAPADNKVNSTIMKKRSSSTQRRPTEK